MKVLGLVFGIGLWDWSLGLVDKFTMRVGECPCCGIFHEHYRECYGLDNNLDNSEKQGVCNQELGRSSGPSGHLNADHTWQAQHPDVDENSQENQDKPDDGNQETDRGVGGSVGKPAYAESLLHLDERWNNQQNPDELYGCNQEIGTA